MGLNQFGDCPEKVKYRADQFYSQRKEQLGHLPGTILRDLALNESAEMRMRRAAIELMLEHGFKEVNHPELRILVAEVRAGMEAKQEVQSVVESAIEAPLPEPSTGPFRASVTTQSLHKPEVK